MPNDAIDLAKQLLKLTETLAAALAEEDWLEAEQTQALRSKTMEELSSFLSGNPPQVSDSLLDVLNTIKGLNQILLDDLTKEKDQVARELMHFNSASHAERAYRSHYEDTE
ncbi:MAG: hypothetical protein ACR2HF_15790 [Methylococcaceae bacterium]